MVYYNNNNNNNNNRTCFTRTTGCVSCSDINNLQYKNINIPAWYEYSLKNRQH